MAQERLSEETLFLSIRELGERIRARRLSPVGVTEAYLERLERIGPRLNAVVTVTRDLALKEARAADAELRAGRDRGPLHGIPYGLKDLVATRGIPTTWGAQPYRNQVLDYDGAVVRKLREAGAVLVAKLAMVELAGCFGYIRADASFTGPARNPWNVDYWAGGSSSGPGAAVAAALVPFAIGSETSGSIITPAAYSGVSGLRPTYGRVSRQGAMALSWTLDKLGPMCRTADDCGLVLKAIAGRDAADPTTGNRRFAWNAPARNDKKFRIAVLRGFEDAGQPAVRANFAASLKTLATICEIAEPVALPDLPYSQAVGTIIDAEGSSAFRDLIESGRTRELRSPNLHWAGSAASMVLAVDYLQAMRARVKMRKALEELFGRYDAVVAPARTTVAYPIKTDFAQAYPGLRGGPPLIPAGNLAGQPAISVPNGFGPNGLPTGIQFTGKMWSEEKLLAIAHAYQQATEWHRRRPALGGAP